MNECEKKLADRDKMPALLNCPFCGSTDVADEYTGTSTTFEGPHDKPTGWHEYQSGWVDCNNCGASSGTVRIDYQHEDFSLRDAVANKWNSRTQ